MSLSFVRAICIGAALLYFTAYPAFAQRFRVQVLASFDSVPSTYFAQRGLKNIWRTTDATGVFRYYFGTYPNALEAEKARQQLIVRGFSQATVIDIEEQRLLADVSRCAYFKGGPLPIVESDSVRFVYFESGKATLSEAGKKQVAYMLQLLKTVPQSHLYVLGYADALGTSLANMELATERTRVVRDFLLDHDIAPERIHLYAYGEIEASSVEDAEEVQNEYERAELRKQFRCAILVWRKSAY
ncbi:MAG: OmpA family protein [Saprospiraceae bacterium]|nr:OmpA family protein [Saprospiraceae bacterium]MDW8483584.1 OmpA family protein [Saprospiraceae bacterium]